MKHLDDAGFSTLWITVLSDTEEHTSTSEWATFWDLNPKHVLSDITGEWHDQAIQTGLPNFYLISTSNMLIWKRIKGWSTRISTYNWYSIEYFPWASEQPGAFD